MLSRFLILGALLVGSNYASQTYRPDQGTAEKTLAGLLEWEILWKDTPQGLRLPVEVPIKVAIHATTQSLSYCSKSLGVCVEYRTPENRNWIRVRGSTIDSAMDDRDAVLKFAGMPARTDAQSQLPLTLGLHGLTGLPSPSGLVWSTILMIKSRDEIVREYREFRPESIELLKRWLRATTLPEAGYRSMSIACYAPSDPAIFVYGDRIGRRGPIVFTVIRDKERQDWVEASIMEGPDQLNRINVLHSIIDSIACATLQF